MASKKLREEDLVLNIIVNGNKGQKEIATLGREIRDAKIEVESLTEKRKQLEKQGKKDTAAYKDLTAQINAQNSIIETSRKRLGELGQSMKLVDQSTAQLRRSLSQLSRQQSQAVPGSEQYLQYEKQIQAIQNRLNEIRLQSQETGNALQRMGSNFQRWFGIISAGIAAFIGATIGIRKAIEEYAQFDDKMADVQKTTNLTKESVKALNSELEKIDTRTSQEDLLGLARIGGKLGFTDANDLEGFVKSTNQIIVALNEDLGGNVEETVNKMGKLVSIFGVKEEFGIEKSILKVGSAINELGMASEANEGYLVDFSNRMAGIAPLAGISIEEILGLGATLDQFGQTAEVSSTALSKLFLNMSKDAATFSKYAGMEVNAFKDLLEKDFMAAFTKVLVGVKGNSEGINELAATLGDLGLDGQRVIGVIGTLANQHAVLTEQIEISKKAFQEGTSVTDEYNVKNETAAAKLDRVRKEVNTFWRELGEKLWPTFTVGNSLLVTFLKILGGIIDFITNNIKWIITLTAGITAYTIAVNAAAIATNVKTTAIKMATVAQRIWNSAILANPIGALISILIAAGSAIALHTKRVDAATAAQNALIDVEKQAEKYSAKQTSAIKSNTEILEDNNRKLDEKLVAVQNLRDIMPGALKDYSDEEILAGKATKAIQEQTKAIILQSKIRASQDKLADILKRESALSEGNIGFWDDMEFKVTKALFGIGAATRGLTKNIKEEGENIKNEYKAVSDELLKIQVEYNNLFKEKPSLLGDEEDAELKRIQSENEKKKKEFENLLQQQQAYQDEVILKTKSLLVQEEANYQDRLKKAGIFGIAREKLSTKQLAALEALEQEHASNMQTINQKLSDENAKKQSDYRKAQMDGLDLVYQKDIDQQKEYYLEKLQLIEEMDISETEKVVERDKLKAEFDKIDQERERNKLNARLLILEQSILIGDLEISEARRVAEETAKVKSDLLDLEIKNAEKAAQEKKETEEKAQKNREDLLKADEKATERIEAAKNSLYRSGARVLSEIFQNNKALAISFLALEKAAAIAHVITNAQKEIAIHRVTAATMGPVAGPIYLAKQTLAAKMSAASAIATIASQAISQAGRSGGGSSRGSSLDNNSSRGQGFIPRATGREEGGFLVQRDQDGKIFNASLDPEKRGFVGKPTVIVGEAGTEFVANAEAVANPSVKAMLDIIDVAQRNGSISTINLQNILSGQLPSKMKGFKNGGYINPEASGFSNSEFSFDISRFEKYFKENSELIKQLKDKLDDGIVAEVALLGKNGFIEKQKELIKIENNANL